MASVNDVRPMFCPAFVCLLSTSNKKTTDWIFMKILSEMYVWTRKKG